MKPEGIGMRSGEYQDPEKVFMQKEAHNSDDDGVDLERAKNAGQALYEANSDPNGTGFKIIEAATTLNPEKLSNSLVDAFRKKHFPGLDNDPNYDRQVVRTFIKIAQERHPIH